MDTNKRGLISDIQEYSTLGGKEIRTFIFLKGCSLNCLWCSNPENQSIKPECFQNLCDKCKECVKKCNKNAVSFNEKGYPVFNREICKTCKEYDCNDNCNTNTLRLIGELITAKELIERVKASKTFSEKSFGGIIISGGEPLLQPDFVRDVVYLCMKNGIPVGLETAGYFNWTKVKDFILRFDFIYFDLKILDSYLHKVLTGKENKIIIRNLKKLAKINPDKITITIPVIRSINSSPEMFEEIAKLCLKLKINKARILPYHTNGVSKYEQLGRYYTLPFAIPPTKSELESLQSILVNRNIACTIVYL